MVKIEIVYVSAERQMVQLALELYTGASVQDALIASGIYHSHPETKHLPVGIYAKQVSLDTVLKTKDRIEIYRPLALDPKEIRRQRAHVKK